MLHELPRDIQATRCCMHMQATRCCMLSCTSCREWHGGAGVSVRRESVQEERDEEQEQQAQGRAPAAKEATRCCSKGDFRLAARPSVLVSPLCLSCCHLSVCLAVTSRRCPTSTPETSIPETSIATERKRGYVIASICSS